MKIIVAVKRVIDAYVPIRVKPDHSSIELTNVKMSINPFCEIAVEEAIRIKEREQASEVVVVSIGPSEAQQQLRAALALGADRAIHICHKEELLPISVAKLLHQIVKRERPKLVLLGKQSIDGDNNQTGQMLAALMGVGQATYASKITVNDGGIEVKREVDGGLCTVALSLPAVVTTDLRLNEPRYTSLPNIVKAKSKPLDTLTVEELEVSLDEHQRVIKVEPPEARSPGVRLESVSALFETIKSSIGER